MVLYVGTFANGAGPPSDNCVLGAPDNLEFIFFFSQNAMLINDVLGRKLAAKGCSFHVGYFLPPPGKLI